MSDNMFDKINRDTLMSLPKLQKLSFASNEIQEVDSGRMAKHTKSMNQESNIVLLFEQGSIQTVDKNCQHNAAEQLLTQRQHVTYIDPIKPIKCQHTIINFWLTRYIDFPAVM